MLILIIRIRIKYLTILFAFHDFSCNLAKTSLKFLKSSNFSKICALSKALLKLIIKITYISFRYNIEIIRMFSNTLVKKIIFDDFKLENNDKQRERTVQRT